MKLKPKNSNQTIKEQPIEEKLKLTSAVCLKKNFSSKKTKENYNNLLCKNHTFSKANFIPNMSKSKQT